MSSDVESIDRRNSVDDRRSINLAGLLELVQDHNTKHDAAHARIRRDFRELEERVHDLVRPLVDQQHTHGARIDSLTNMPVDVTKLVFTPKVVFAVVAVVLSIWVGFWGSTSGLRSDMRDILTRMATEQRVADANAKLLEQNSAMINKALETIGKRQDLLTLQYNELNTRIITREK